MNVADLVGAFTGFVLTLLVLSYLLGDNPLFRIAIHLFIGVATGYAAVIAWYDVIWPQIILPLFQGSLMERVLFSVVPLFLAALLLMKASPRLRGLGSVPMAFLVGVGASTAIGGGVLGTLFPQTMATIDIYEGPLSLSLLLEGGLVILGTITTLVYFQFTARRSRLQVDSGQRAAVVQWLSTIGQAFIAIALGALFAGAYLAALAAMVERLDFLVNFIAGLISA